MLDEITIKNFIINKKQQVKFPTEKDIKKCFDIFADNVIPELRQIKQSENKKTNVFNMFNAYAASNANSITRTFNTKLGLFWEELSILSPIVMSPEIDFDEKIVGVDVVLLLNNDIYYTQLKTQKNTLTGSQAPRVIEELNRFKNSLFVACINNDSKWTAPKEVNRIVGKEYWDLIGIDYENIIKNLCILINKVENVIKE